MEFRKELRQALDGSEELTSSWATTANVVRKTARKVIGVTGKMTSGQKKEDKETW